ncbi:type II secretion system protein [Paucibacter sp. APW11]|uniref:Type II secretion system protein n=1 Tax=Roseateles aquae TaxID=3077235 RepID=A0ABU3P6F5_9BURK|nr:type II secretion system protein [Paucibacter sp. APW11]MDT8998157.1 type II secretion system protein [Paucibacter sp. APW11]
MVRPAARSQRGFSVIEMMVVLTLMLLIAVAAAPFASSWGNQAAVRQTQSLLLQAMALAKATALRNPQASPADQPAATLLSSAAGLCVFAGTPSSLACSGALWRATPSASIQLQGATSQCIALASDGRPLNASVGSTDCLSTLSYTISRGNETSQAQLN